MNISWRHLLIFLALALLLGLAFLNQALLMTYLIEPFARVVWLLVKLFLIVDQSVYWMLLIFATLTFALRIVPGRPEPHGRASHFNPPHVEDRFAYWQALLRAAEDDANARQALQDNLKRLDKSIDALAEENEHGEIRLPPVKPGFWQRYSAWWAWLFPDGRFGKQRRHADLTLEQCVDQVLDSLETRLEMKHDRSTNPSNDR